MPDEPAAPEDRAAPDVRPPADPGLGFLDRALSWITPVERGEGTSALVLALDVCVLLCAYYVLKPVREGLILSEASGAELKSYAAVGQILLLIPIVPAYSWLVGRVERGRLIRTVTLVFVACLVAFYFAAKLQVPGLGILFFLWVGIFNLMVVAQFWAFASDLYSRRQGERLFPIVAFGASMGAVAGSQLTSLLVKPLGISQMMLVSAGLLLVALFLSRAAERVTARCQLSTAALALRKKAGAGAAVAEGAGVVAAEAKPDQAPRKGAFRLVLQSRYLLLIGVLMLLLNLVNSTGEFVLGSLVKESVPAGVDAKEHISAFYSRYFLWVNLIGAVIQLFVTPRVLRRYGVAGALLVLPTVALLGYATIALVPFLFVARWGKIAENSLDYSLNNTVRNALFLPLGSEEKYKAKQVVDTLFVRGGDVASAGLVFLGRHLFALPLSVFALVNAVAAALWFWVAWQLGREYATTSESTHR
ncbi:MAG TPA: Npt1/Npt2 family nucleotide transporter [Polyangiaceae bacterium]|nr:Npt1/Npt2 family nucleotide transporter [Polyangiaceae bacterium]